MTHDPTTTDPRLLDGSATDFESSLLKAALEEAPAPEMSAKMMAPLAAGPAAAAAVGGSKLLSGGLKSAAAKWIGAGASVLLAGGAYYLSTAPKEPPAAVHSTPPVTEPPEPKLNEPLVEHEESETEVQAPEAVRDHQPATSQKKPVRAVPEKKSPSTLSEEMRLLDQARSALKSRKDPAEALRLLGLYERKYPQGALRQEATVLRVSALEESGARERADELKSEFLKANPKSAHKKQLEDSPSSSK